MQRAERERVGKQKTKALKIDTNGCFLEEKIVPSIRWNRAQERFPSAHLHADSRFLRFLMTHSAERTPPERTVSERNPDIQSGELCLNSTVGCWGKDARIALSLFTSVLLSSCIKTAITPIKPHHTARSLECTHAHSLTSSSISSATFYPFIGHIVCVAIT